MPGSRPGWRAMANGSIEAALLDIVEQLSRLQVPFALVGGLAVSIRAEVRFTRDVDVVVGVNDDARTEWLVRELRLVGYAPVTLVEQDDQRRIATVRLRSPSDVVVDLIGATCGIESEIVARASPVSLDGVGLVPVARSEELLAMKVLSVTERRPQDQIDARSLLLSLGPGSIDEVTENLRHMTERGYSRGQDLASKLAIVAAAVRRDTE